MSYYDDYSSVQSPIVYADGSVALQSLQLPSSSFFEGIVPLCNWGDPVTLTLAASSLSDDLLNLQADFYQVQIMTTGVDRLGSFVPSDSGIGSYEIETLVPSAIYKDTSFYYLHGTSDAIEHDVERMVAFGATPNSSLQFVMIPDSPDMEIQDGVVDTFRFIAVNDFSSN